MAKKQKYRIKNWKEYNNALAKRGSITVWVSDDALAGWRHRGKNARGRPLVFSDAAILCALTLRAVFRLPLRQTEAFLQSIFALLGCDLPVPDYSTLCLREKTLSVPLVRTRQGPLHLVLDSTGLKIRGEGEWRVRHGKSGHRKWRRFHIGIDALSREIVVEDLSLSRVHDATAGVRLLQAAPEETATVTADGAYDKLKIYLACAQKEALPIIPPQKNARIRHMRKDPRDGKWKMDIPYLESRHETIRAIRRGGRRKWKRESGYHRRSIVETTMYRMKHIFGPGLKSKRIARQRTEALVRCRALNCMTAFGMPETARVT